MRQGEEISLSEEMSQNEENTNVVVTEKKCEKNKGAVKERYLKWCHLGKKPPPLKSLAQDFDMPSKFFKMLEKPQAEVELLAITLYVDALKQKLEKGQGLLRGLDKENTRILDHSFYAAMEDQWKKNVDGPWGPAHTGQQEQWGWIPTRGLISTVRGRDRDDDQPWWKAKNIIMICNVGKRWCTVHVDLLAWKCYVYTPFLHKLTEKVSRERLGIRMRPITKFMLPLFRASAYFKDGNREMPENPCITTILVAQEEQFTCENPMDSGIYACMYADRLITGTPSIRWGNVPDNVVDYRRQMAIRIFDRCYEC